jgi:hypothetical protein
MRNTLRRIRFVLSKLKKKHRCYKFNSFFQNIHIDEKWFYIIKVKRRYILVVDEKLPYCDAESKNFITKVMFLAVIARPTEILKHKSGILAGNLESGQLPNVSLLNKAAKLSKRNIGNQSCECEQSCIFGFAA